MNVASLKLVHEIEKGVGGANVETGPGIGEFQQPDQSEQI